MGLVESGATYIANKASYRHLESADSSAAANGSESAVARRMAKSDLRKSISGIENCDLPVVDGNNGT